MASLPGGMGATLIPGLPRLSSIPHIQTAPPAGAGLPTVAPVTSQHLTLDSAKQILDQVRAGRMEPAKAFNLLKGLDMATRKQLARQLLNDSAMGGGKHSDELQALGQLPLGKDPGHSATGTFRPAGIGSHLISDIGATISGIPAGIALAGKATIEDANALRHGQAPTNVYHDILKPVGESYAQTYGPLAHGDIGAFGHNLAQHPLGPALDALSLVSMGAGAAARGAAVGRAVQAGEVTALRGGAAGEALVGGRYTVQQLKNGSFGVREGNQWITGNLPDKATAIAHAQSLISPTGTSKMAAFAKSGGRGGLIDRYEDKYRPNVHDRADKVVATELQKTMEDPNLQLGRRSFKEGLKGIGQDFKATLKSDLAKFHAKTTDPKLLKDSQSRAVAGVQVGGTALIREATDGVKAGAIYLRPAYLPNNWAGNTFMNLVHQGVLAPVNLAKSFMMTKALGDRYMAVIDKSLGKNAATTLSSGKGKGFVNAAMDPVMKVMGAAADQPFRRAAWLHEARRAGYNNLGKVKELMDRAAAGDEGAYMEMAKISRKAQEEIVKFGELSDRESFVARNLFFVYSWVKGATRYGGRFALQHPIQTNVYSHLSEDVGNPYIKKTIGGVPSFMHGVIPVGHDSKGNPILINPFALNPLGTAMQTGQAALGTAKALIHPEQFNKFKDTDIVDMMAPLPKAYLAAREGGKPLEAQIKQTIAPIRLYHDLKHPGSGSLFPTSRTEALGKYTFGSMFPRKADAQAMQRTLERENHDDPVARLALDQEVYKKATGHDVPESLVKEYKVDVQRDRAMKSFQRQYAQNHGQSGFRNLPPKNRAAAAILFLVHIGSLNETEADQYMKEIDGMSNDAQAKEAAANLWSNTGVGVYKRAWDDMMRNVRGLRDSGKRSG